VHRRETSNALNASVRCEQKRLQRLSETVLANNRVTQVVRQWIPDRRASHTESPSAVGAELVTRYDQEPLGSGAKMLPWCDTCDWLAQFHEVLRRLTVQTVEHHDAEFVHDSLRNIQPMQLSSMIRLRYEYDTITRVNDFVVTTTIRQCDYNTRLWGGYDKVHCRFIAGALHDTRAIKVKVWTLATAPLTWVRLVTSSALQSRKWQLSQWCRSALCGHPLPVLMDNWTHGAASRHTIAPISHTRLSPRSHSYYSFPVPLRVWGWVGLNTRS